jgi:succinoglycan biosynthesis transport protein ExoP
MSTHLESRKRSRPSTAVQTYLRGTLRSAADQFSNHRERVIDSAVETFQGTLWRIVRNRKWTIFAFALMVVALVLTASFLMRPQYDAAGQVVFHREGGGEVLGFKGVDTSLLDDPEDRAAIDTQIGILQTDALAMQVINDLHLDKNPDFVGGTGRTPNEDQLAALFHKSLKISKVKGTQLIRIQFRSINPRLAADVVNELAKAYLDQYYRNQFQASSQISDFLANQLKELQAKVEESQQKLVDYQKENGIFGLDEKQNIVTAKLDDLNRALTAAEADRVQREVDYRLASSGNPELLARLGPENLLTKLRGQQADLENQLAQISVELGPSHPKRIELAKQLEQARQSVDAEINRIGERINYEYQSAIGRERLLRSALETQKQAADNLNANAIQFNILKHEFETNRNLYEDLLQKQKEVGISSSLKSNNIWIVDPARPPKLPSEPNIPRNFAASLVLGVFGGVSLAFALTKMNEKISVLEQALTYSALPSVGVVPLLDDKTRNVPPQLTKRTNGNPLQFTAAKWDVRPELVSLVEPMSLAAESYRALLTSVLLSQSAPPAVILMTSALPGEGKTTVSMNLAIALARLRRRVLLVDADLRRPSVHRALRLDPDTGLGALLRKSTTFEEAVISCSDLPNLFILPAGPTKLPDDAELLSYGFKDLVDNWRQRFDHIIIDTPPVLAMTDAVCISVEADSVILVVRSGQITKDEFLRAQDLLLKVNARLTGFVLNGADMSSAGFRYYEGYYHDRNPDVSPKSARPF